jgi:hypothetical protein
MDYCFVKRTLDRLFLVERPSFHACGRQVSEWRILGHHVGDQDLYDQWQEPREGNHRGDIRKGA